MILSIDTMRPADAYQLGWADREEELARQAEVEGHVAATRMGRELDVILDHAEAIAPWPVESLYPPQVPGGAIYDQEGRKG